MLSKRQLNDIRQMIGDLNEIVTFHIDDNDIRDDAKRLINCIDELLNDCEMK